MASPKLCFLIFVVSVIIGILAQESTSPEEELSDEPAYSDESIDSQISESRSYGTKTSRTSNYSGGTKGGSNGSVKGRYRGTKSSSGVKGRSYYSGTKTGVKGGSRKGSFRGDCDSNPVAPINGQITCSSTSGCRATCMNNYKFPNGRETMTIECRSGKWLPIDTEWASVPACEPICSPECQNSGICIAPGECHCTENFSGPQCQFQDQPCYNSPPLPRNSKRSCKGSKHCTIQCADGYVFPDGSAITNLQCKDGNWIPTRNDWVTVPDCEATCTPPCQNGGNCLSLDVCQCPKDFRGPQCQYSADVCSAEKIGFNGGYNCTGTMDYFSCSLICPAGIEFEFPPALKYTCTYNEGVFKPERIPQCVIDDTMELVRVGGSHYSYHKVTNHSWSTQDMFGSISGSNQRNNYEWSSNRTSSSRGDMNPAEFTSAKEDWDGSFHGVFETGNSMAIVQQKLPEPAVCFTWGGTHYKTFDGRIFSFDSECSHTLVQDAADGIFTITSSNSPSCRTGGICSRIIKIFIERKEYTLSLNEEGIPEIRGKNKVLPVPTQIPGLRVEMVAHFVLVTLDAVGASIKWDGASLVQIEATESLWNRTAGLCGNMNGEPDDDLTAKDGSHPKSVATLASSWRVEEIGETCDEAPNLQHSCHSKQDLASDASAFCSQLLSDRRFHACSNTLDQIILQNTCEWDYCACRDQDRRKCACDTMSVYVRHCAQKGVVTMSGWRDVNICPVECTGGRIYMGCGPKNEASCNAATTDTKPIDEKNCEEGCFCPKGSVLHDGQCISVEECPCRLRSRTFNPGSSIVKDCNTCTCISGKWTCTQAKCGARCAAIGDPHYFTFDGKHYDFMGRCNYYLIQGENYSIAGENVGCPGALSEAMGYVPPSLPSCTKSVLIRINDVQIKLGQNQQLLVNGVEMEKLPITAGGVKIRVASSIFLVAKLPNGLEVWWDGVSRVYVNAPPEFHDKTKGLCGTFNMNQKDDFLTPDGDVEQAVVPFANKWKTHESCDDIPEKESNNPCDMNPHRREAAKQHCSKLKSSLFSDCHWYVDPEVYEKDCMYDMCSCETTIGHCLCPILAAYAKQCSHEGVKLDWRQGIDECKINCPAGQVYQTCGNSCTRSCNHISFEENCKQDCVEGCNCPEGQTLDDKNECIPIGQCPCQYGGLEFVAGYREVRPGTKSQELCTCAGGLWNCKRATSEDVQNHPAASDMKSICSAHKNQEVTTCMPAEIKTCRNMHNSVSQSVAVCKPGCVCRDGYVLDVPSGECVKEMECPCYHGGRSYKEGSKMQEECNTCTCNNGKWTCTDRICAGICSAWGDSHYTTFDGKVYEFQGACDYVLAKGSLSQEESFEVSTQNVPCGTTGVTCSKSITLAVGAGEKREMITLTKGNELPKGNLNRIAIRKSGLFVFLDVPDLGLVLQWDEGTRVYIRLDPKWKGRTKGLCGDYNNDAEDDFKTPSGGVSEAAAILFGDSWKQKPLCPKSREIQDTCAIHEERRPWATMKCNVLKSSQFNACHSEVDVGPYVDKCIFDTCGCDVGGDCDCLCTALAAYAQECNTRGVPIKWRTQKLCPIQCDETCSEYTPCMSTCPLETCDNTLTMSENLHLCKQDSCVEGCLPKPCPDGQIYANGSHTECVPRATCKPVCMEIDGVSYYEGDQITGDDCHSCLCSRGKKICKGVPCTTTTEQPTTVPMEQMHECIDGWTAWLNKDSNIKGKKKLKDVEPLPSTLDLLGVQGSAVCTKDQMVDIRCRTVGSKLSVKETGLDVECSLQRGLYCQSESKGASCVDFEISVLCQCGGTTDRVTTTVTENTTRTTISTTVSKYQPCDVNHPNQPHPRDCSKFYHCVPTENGPELVEKPCGPGTLYNPVAQICDWPASVFSIRPECGSETSSTVLPFIVPTTPVGICPDGEIWSECAIQCSRACLHYQYVLTTQGHCDENNDCVPGCVPVNRPECPSMFLWRDFSTCVGLADCTCVSRNNEVIKPGDVVKESDCEVCQCLNNHYTCDKSSCEKQPPPGAKIIPKLPATTERQLLCPEYDVMSLITEPEPLSDEAFKASSYRHDGFQPSMAKLISNLSDSNSGSWMPAKVDDKQWISVDLGRPEKIYGVILSKNPSLEEYVETYNIYYTPDNNRDDFIPVTESGSKLPKIFNGPGDNSEVARNYFDSPFTARTIKIVPRTWHNGIAINLDIIGCNDENVRTIPMTHKPVTYSSTWESSQTLTIENTTSVYRATTEHGSKSDRIMITTSHVSPLPLCAEGNQIELIRSAPPGTIILDAKSESSPYFAAKNAILNSKVDEHSGGSWVPEHFDKDQWLSITLSKPVPIYGVIVQGSPSNEEYVTSYKVLYSEDGQTFSYILDERNIEKAFRGSVDKNKPVKQIFHDPIEAKIIRIIPQTWQNGIAMRVDLIGCSSELTSTTTVYTAAMTPSTTTLPTSVTQDLGVVTVSEHTEKKIIPICDDPLGLDNSMMSDEQVKASSTYDKLLPDLRLSSEGIWRPNVDNPDQYVEFDFYEPRNLTGVETKGSGDIWTTVYKVLYSHDGLHWNPVINEDGSDKKFLANYDGVSSKTNYFERPIHARYLRVQPITWHEHIGLKVEIHGCYLPYHSTTTQTQILRNLTTISTETTTVTELLVTCNICDGVEKTNEYNCHCNGTDWWDGESCVTKQQCPCFVGHIPYAVGSFYYTEDCQHCDCTLGGIPACRVKTCEPCSDPGLQSIVTKELCHCICKPCPEKTRLCPTSNICINETSWCDGVQDCPDDEIDCATAPSTLEAIRQQTTVTSLTTVTETIRTTKITEVDAELVCQTPTCPPGYSVVLKQAKLYAEVYDMQRGPANSGVKGGVKGGVNGGVTGSVKGNRKGGVKGSYGQYSKGGSSMNMKYSSLKSHGTGSSNGDKSTRNVCPEFSCKSDRPPPRFPNSPPVACPEVQCPPGYKLIYEKISFYQYDPCPRYMCKPPPPMEFVCNVTGRTFNTFDDIEYKYDICNHIIARDMEFNNWYITLIKECDKLGWSCQRVLAVAFDDHNMFLYPDLHIDIDDYTFSPNQVKLLSDKDKAFKITRVGNSLHFVSYRYGFWIVWDTNSNVKVGVTSKLAGHVDGLCGYFDGHSSNDRQKPDGEQAKSTVEFGNSWAMDDTPECEPQVCPQHVQEEAWAICNAVKHRTLAVCSGVVDLEKFVSRCLETTCNCLRGNSTASECRCHELTAFVAECQAADSNVDLPTWRTDHDCPASCPAPFVHKDCFRYKCEATCNNLQETDPCPIMPGVCFSGCFCPDGKVRRGDECILATECRDCLCDGFGNGKFVTFDKKDLAFNGNCTYVLSRDMPHGIQGSDGNHLYEVLVTNTACPRGICTEAITVLFKEHSVQVKQGDTTKELIVFVDGKLIERFPYASSWLTLEEAPGKDITLLIPSIQLEIASFRHNFAFMVRLPSHTFGGAMEGLCGNCDGYSANDFRKRDGEVTDDDNQFGTSWLAKKLPTDLGLSNEECALKPKKQCEVSDADESLCNKLLDGKRFGQCHEIINPDPYLARCREDLCEKSDICNNLEAYARSCLQAGLCLNWRGDDVCPYECPSHLKYRSCGPGCAETCNDVEGKEEVKCLLSQTEGCFCPEGQILVNGTCIDRSRFLACDEDGHVNGDVWNRDKCTECRCQDKTITCEKTECPIADTICANGSRATLVVDTKDDCCPKYLCIPEEVANITKECPESQQPVCGFGQIMKLILGSDGCPNYACQCVPKEECQLLQHNATFDDIIKELEMYSETQKEPGMVRVTDTSGCCPVSKLVCKPETCPERPKCEEFYAVETTQTKEFCCPTHECKPEKDVCFYTFESSKGTKTVPKVTAKRLGEHWQDGLCKSCVCEELNGDVNSKCVTTECASVENHPDISDYVIEEVLLEDQCCPTFERTACKYNDTVYAIGELWTPNPKDKCVNMECTRDTNTIQKKVLQTECKTNCDKGYKYEPSSDKSLHCCGECVAFACVVGDHIKNIGEEWYSEDYCTRYECNKGNGSLQVQSQTETCAESSTQDYEDFEIDLKRIPGKCCPDTVKTGCRHDGKIYTPGQQWVSPIDVCVTEMCINTSEGLIKKQEKTTCSKDCPFGWEYEEAPFGQCCGECKQHFCVDEEVLYRPDEIWHSADKCTTFQCKNDADQFVTHSSSEKCPDISECAPEMIYSDGCCSRCNITALSQKKENCVASKIDSNITIGMFKEHTAGSGLCKNVEAIEGLTECHGNCDSSTYLNTDTWSQDSKCECCMPTEYEPIFIELICENNRKLKKRLQVPKVCTCETCASAKGRLNEQRKGTKTTKG